MTERADLTQVAEQVNEVRGRQLPRYPAYKPSGVQWLDSIPEHWSVRRLKFIGDVRTSNVDKKSAEDEETVRLCNYIDVYHNEYITADIAFMTATATPEEIRRFHLHAGDVLITKDSEEWNDIAVPAFVDEPLDGVLCGYHLAQIRPIRGRMFGEYLFRAFASRALREQFHVRANGITRFGLSRDAITSAWFPIPPKEEQAAITRFLRRETAEIDALIARKRRLIELLKEKRTALISHAVTKGLNPKAPMKPSGIDWLGDVPVHWEVLPLRRYSKFIQTGCTPPTGQREYYEQGTLPWYGPGSFSDDLALGEPTKLINMCAVQNGAARLFRANSVLVVTIGATVGKVGLLNDDASTNQQITAVTVERRRVDGRFLAYQLKIREPVLRGTAPSNTLPILDQQAIAAFPAVFPPISEQQRIVAYLDDQDVRLRTPLVKITRAIELLQEHRSALISAAVAGKIDVRQVNL